MGRPSSHALSLVDEAGSDGATIKNVSPKPRFRSPFSGTITLVIIAAFMAMARAAHTLLAQPFRHRKVRVPVFLSLAEAASFPIAIAFWAFMSYKAHSRLHIPNWKYRMSMYALMGFIDSINSFCSATAVIRLPVVILTISKASSIIFSVVFARLMTNKQFTKFHYLAVGIMVMASGVMMFKIDADNKGDSSEEFLKFYLVVGASFLSAVSLGLLGVVTYKFVRHENQKSDLLCIAEMNAFQSLFMFLFLLPLFGHREVLQWSSTSFMPFLDNGELRKLIWIMVAWVICRPIGLFLTIAATSFASATFTRALGAPRRLLVIVISLVIWGETGSKFGWLDAISIASMCISLSVYAFGGSILQKMKSAQATATLKDVESVKVVKVLATTQSP